MYCPYCGKENSDQAKYCSRCGKKLVVNKTQSSTTDSSMPSEPPISPDNGKDKKKPKKWIIPVVIALVAVVVIILIVVSRTASGSGTDEPVVWQSGDNMQIMDAGFTDRQITEEESAILAAQDVSDAMGYENAFDDLTLYLSTTTNGGCFYRLQETYQGIPVYQRYVIVVASEEGNAQGLYTDAVDIPEDLSLTPTLTDEEAGDAVAAYIQSQGEEVSEDMAISELSDDALVIYIPDESESACLAYLLTVENSFYSVVLNAQTGEVLEYASTVDDIADTGIIAGGAVSFPVDYDENSNVYTMGDFERNIYIYNMDKEVPAYEYVNGIWTAEIMMNSASDVTSEGDAIFGNQPEEEDNKADVAANLLSAVCQIADWYNTLGQRIPFGRVGLYYNCSFLKSDGGKYGANALGGVNPENSGDDDNADQFGTLQLGYDLDGTETDLIAHEYTHIVERDHDAVTGDQCDAGIREGLADTFACLYTKDWYVDGSSAGHRDAADPAADHYPVTVTDHNESGIADSHAYASVISHAAYLMKESGEFDWDQLTDLWYQTLLTLPSDCSYANLAYNMYRLACNGLYSSEQIMAVVHAFGEVGISTYWTVNNHIVIEVYDKLGDYYDDYTVEVFGEEIDWETWDEKAEEGEEVPGGTSFHQTYHVDEQEPWEEELPDGEYEIKVIDNIWPWGSDERTIDVMVSEEYDEKDLPFYIMGAEYVAAPGAAIVVEDAEGNEVDISSAEVFKIEKNDDARKFLGDLTDLEEIPLTDDILDVPEYNCYTLRIHLSDDTMIESDEDDSDAGIVHHTVRVREGGSDTITIILPEATESQEESEGIPITQDMYPELLEGGLTKEQFEVALAYAPEEMENDEIDKDYLLSMVDMICYDFPDLCFGGTMTDPHGENLSHWISSLDAVNNFLSVLTDTPLSASDAQGWEDDLVINGDTVDVTLHDGEWMTPYATITDSVLWEDSMIVTYEIRSTGTADYYPNGTGTRTALLTQTEEGRYRVNQIAQGTPEEIYHTDRQEILAIDEGGWINEIIYYDLISLEGTNNSHQAINDGLEADYQDFLSITERMTGMTISEIEASNDYLYHFVGAGVTNIQDGVFSVRYDQWTLESDTGKRHYGLTYSLETGEQMGIRDLTDLSDEELLSQIKAALREYLNNISLLTSSRENTINNYTLDDIASGINFRNSGRLSFFVQDDEIYILVPPGELFDDIWSNDAVPTGIYISGAEGKGNDANSDSETYAVDDDYIFPDSGSRYLSQSELVSLTDDELRIARNEIYARHGRKFSDPTLQAYFESKSWYNGTIEADDFDESVFNDYETANAKLIHEYEEER